MFHFRAAPKRGRLSQRVSLTKTSEKGRISLRKSLQMTANKLGERETEPQQKDVIPDLAAVVPEVESNAVQMEEDMGNVVGKISQENDQSANLSNLAVDPESTTTVLSNEVSFFQKTNFVALASNKHFKMLNKEGEVF